MPTVLNQTDRTNSYDGTCDLCGTTVGAGAGLLFRTRSTRPGQYHNGRSQWITRHRDGECAEHNLPPVHTNVADAPRERRTVGQSMAARLFNEFDIPAGHYAVPCETNRNDLDFYRVDRVTEGRYAGKLFVKVVIGGRPARTLWRTAARDVLLRIAAHGPATASMRYGQEIGRCYACNRHLTDETSRALGIGPECRRQGRTVSVTMQEMREQQDIIERARSEERREAANARARQAAEAAQLVLMSELGTGEEL